MTLDFDVLEQYADIKVFVPNVAGEKVFVAAVTAESCMDNLGKAASSDIDQKTDLPSLST